MKLLPVTVMVAPTGPEAGDKPVMTGGGVTVKLLVLLGFPLTVTTTLPDVAPQEPEPASWWHSTRPK